MGANNDPNRDVSLILRTSYGGPLSFLLLAADKGYLAAKGMNVTFAAGAGLKQSYPRLARGVMMLDIATSPR